ncbi:MAG: hypothetical protein ICV60_15010 [Pyrinomonadaceae bacterium]|nr:hypothetical protein [Pyrinomonadaceae bacterium]
MLHTDTLQPVDLDELVSPGYFKDTDKIDLYVRRNPSEADPNNPNSPVQITTKDIKGAGCEIPLSVQSDIKHVSQFGLKEVWVGGKAGGHNRWEHSRGAYNAGLIWLKVLEADNRVKDHCMRWPADTWEKIRALVGTALLLHDYGHLPFAHLLNEVLETINWLPSAAKWAGLEAAVLQHRLVGEPLKHTWKALLDEIIKPKADRPLYSDDVCSIIKDLILGAHGVPWMQAIVNSPVDADKIDYIRFDSGFLTSTEYPIRPRILEEKPTQWLTEFLNDQWVNHAGLLCLHGRSAIAAADLWRERMFLYDRFYLSPEVRLPERMAFEIVQQFVIHATMSGDFVQTLKEESLRSYPEQVETKKGERIMPIEEKYQTIRDIMLHLQKKIRDEKREFPLLEWMMQKLEQYKGIDKGYKELLGRCFSSLSALESGTTKLPQVVKRSLVQEPLLLERSDCKRAMEVLRPLQHTYCREALIDIVQMPRVLSAPRRWHTGFGRHDKPGMDYSILVPDGPVSTWAPKSRAIRPLTDECVKELRHPFCRVTVIAPERADSAQADYVWDRVRSALLEANLGLVEGIKELR